MAQSSLPESLSSAEMPIEPRAAQYHASSGTLSVMRKNVCCASAACSFVSVIRQLLSHSHCVASEWAHLPRRGCPLDQTRMHRVALRERDSLGAIDRGRHE